MQPKLANLSIARDAGEQASDQEATTVDDGRRMFEANFFIRNRRVRPPIFATLLSSLPSRMLHQSPLHNQSATKRRVRDSLLFMHARALPSDSGDGGDCQMRTPSLCHRTCASSSSTSSKDDARERKKAKKSSCLFAAQLQVATGGKGEFAHAQTEQSATRLW